MGVNSEVWGLPATWVDGGVTEQKADIKYAAASYDTYRELYDAGRIDINSIDISCAYWGIGTGSILTKQYYLSPYQRDGETVVAVDPAIDNTVQPMILITDTIGTAQHVNYNNRYSPMRTTIPPASTPYNNKVVLSFNYQKVMLVPMVIYKNTGFASTTSSATLYDFITDETYTGKEVIGFGYQFYCGAGGDTNRSKLLTSLASPCNYKGYDLYYGSNYFWANGGCNLLNHNVEIGTSNNTYIGCSHTATTTDIENTVGDALTALAYKYSKSASTSIYVYYFDPDNELWKINKTGVRSGDTKWYEYPYIEVTDDNVDAFKDYALEQIAYLGFPFVYDPDNAARGQIGDLGVYLPVFDENGVTTGNYEEGTNALRLPNSEWIDGREGAGYDPDRRENDDFGYLYNPFTDSRFGTALNVWTMYQQDMIDVIDSINNLWLQDPDGNSKWQLNFKGSNPDDYIVSCKAMLLDIGHTQESYTFKLGPVSFDHISCYKYADTGHFSFGSIDIKAYYGDFRDYSPYTSMELYIPLCGTVDIDPEFFIGHSMEIIMMYDVYTGACTAGIYRDHYTLYKAVNGQIGADIPVSVQQMGTYQNTIHALQAAQKQNEIRLAASAAAVAVGAATILAAPATGGASLIAGAGLISGAASILSGAEQEKNYDYQISHTQPVPAQTTAAETQNNFCLGQRYAILYIKRAKMLSSYDAEIYSHTIGNACLINGYVGSQTGLVVCNSVDLSGVPATVEEINAIKQALANGVYV